MEWFPNKKRKRKQTSLEMRTDVHDLYEPSREAYGQAYHIQEKEEEQKESEGN